MSDQLAILNGLRRDLDTIEMKAQPLSDEDLADLNGAEELFMQIFKRHQILTRDLKVGPPLKLEKK